MMDRQTELASGLKSKNILLQPSIIILERIKVIVSAELETKELGLRIQKVLGFYF